MTNFILRVSFKSKKTSEREGPTDMGATAILQTETSKDRDAQAIYERTLQVNKVCTRFRCL